MTAPKRIAMAVILALLLLFAGIGAIAAFGQNATGLRAEGPEQDAAIELMKTVGTSTTDCATTDNVVVPMSTTVVYCFRVLNTGHQSLVIHDLADTQLGTILSGYSYSLAPGANVFVTRSVTLYASAVNTATWTARTATGLVAASSDTARVTVLSSTDQGAYLGGHVFLDTNANCVYEPWLGESGVGAALLTRNGGATTSSNFYDGWYSFFLPAALLPGNFSVTVAPPPGYTTDCPLTVSQYVTNGALITNVDFGLVQVTTSTPTSTATPTQTSTPTGTATATATTTTTATTTETATATATATATETSTPTATTTATTTTTATATATPTTTTTPQWKLYLPLILMSGSPG